MAQKPPPQSEEDAGGAPEWMVTFSDCMTLLLTFFVLLLSFASFEKDTLLPIGQSFAQVLPAIGLTGVSNRGCMEEKQDSQEPVQNRNGTETKTPNRNDMDNFMREKKPLDFRNLKVFSVPSDQFFWGQGTAISNSGRETLDALAFFLNSTTGRVVISENGPDGKLELGIQRTMAVLEYLSARQKLESGRFSISGSSTLRAPPPFRQLEITLLERSIYE